MNYVFTGFYPAHYDTPEGSRMVEPGDEVEWEQPPDSWWTEPPAAQPEPKPSAKPKPEPKE